jgi:hypothetical protein
MLLYPPQKSPPRVASRCPSLAFHSISLFFLHGVFYCYLPCICLASCCRLPPAGIQLSHHGAPQIGADQLCHHTLFVKPTHSFQPITNLLTILDAYIIFMGLLSIAVMLPAGNVKAIDAYFFGASASTESGLNTLVFDIISTVLVFKVKF